MSVSHPEPAGAGAAEISRRCGRPRADRRRLSGHRNGRSRWLLTACRLRQGDLRHRSPRRRYFLLQEWRQRLLDLPWRLEPPLRILGHHGRHDNGQLNGHLGTRQVQGERFHGLVRLQDVVEIRPLEWRISRQQIIERTAQAVDVGPDINVSRVVGLLGCHVGGRASNWPACVNVPTGDCSC